MFNFEMVFQEGSMKFLICILCFVTSGFLHSNSLTKEQKKSLKKEARWLAQFDIKYAAKWQAPDETVKRTWDCSNTAQYLYKRALGIDIPVGSYNIYIYLRNINKLKEPDLLPDGTVDSDALKKKLKTGDLLFWTNTHNDIPPEHVPPIGHVMIYLGKTKSGRMRAAGADTWEDGLITKKGGADIYYFDPNKNMGCFKDKKTKKCMPDRMSKFVGFGNPF